MKVVVVPFWSLMVAFLLGGFPAKALDVELPNDSGSTTKSWKFSGYVEPFYCPTPNLLSLASRRFIYSYNTTAHPNVNLALGQFSWSRPRFRTNVGLMWGTYPSGNLSHEPARLRHIYEANLGFKLFADKDIWLDVGVFPSHIGFEGAIGKDCYTLTRSMMADNSPYYESGLRLSIPIDGEKWNLKLLVLNGWQRMELRSDSKIPAFGHQLEYKPDSKWLINSSSFIGSAYPDSSLRMRYFHNFYIKREVAGNFDFIFGLDNGLEQMGHSSGSLNFWFSPNMIIRKTFLKKFSAAIRGEYYHDPNGVIIASVMPNGFRVMAFSGNLDWKFNRHFMFRMEAKRYISRDPLFGTLSDSGNGTTFRRYFNQITFSFAAWF